LGWFEEGGKKKEVALVTSRVAHEEAMLPQVAVQGIHHLIELWKSGKYLPNTLPPSVSKRNIGVSWTDTLSPSAIYMSGVECVAQFRPFIPR
jgi:hypothetical protein